MKLSVKFTPYSVYKEYKEEHAVPMNESRYALFVRFVYIRGNIARTATTKTCRIRVDRNIPLMANKQMAMCLWAS